MDFRPLKEAVQKQFKRMQSAGTLLISTVNKDLLWETYIKSFPEGSNPMFRQRTEHDCSCCRHFLKKMGGLVVIENGELITLWDIKVDGPYQTVVDALAQLVKAHDIDNLFLSAERVAGVGNNFQPFEGNIITWDHFYLQLPTSVVLKGDEIGPKLSARRADYDVLLRSLTELKLEDVDAVLDLIGQNSLYRGEEHQASLQAFRKLQIAFNKIRSISGRSCFVWSVIESTMGSVVRMRNTSIGTLLVDLAEGKDLDDAVKAFEAKVAPANYKRPTALVTKAMIENAKKKVDELGLTSALERRFATLDDIKITDVLYADRSIKKKLGGDVFDDLAPTKATSKKKLDKVEEVGIEDFITNILPKATSLEVMLENQHLSRLVSLIAPCDATAKNLFKWNNGFSWSYAGDFTDSVKERVKAAGGKVDGDLRCSLSWFNYDDLDLHMKEPGGNEIYYGNRNSLAGSLDVDMNVNPTTRSAVENICYPDRKRMKNGVYTLFVQNFNKRESNDVGFEVEIEFDGITHTFNYTKAVADRTNVEVAKIKVTDGKFDVVPSIPSSQSVKEAWGIKTQDFVPVSAIMMSPNYWGTNRVGNKHYIFTLTGCHNDGTTRGFYNEFLLPELNEHRKVLEIVASKTKVKESENQMSGIGFSSTQKGAILCRVKGSFSRIVKIVF